MRSWWLLLAATAVPASGQTLTLRDAAASALASHPSQALAQGGVERADAWFAQVRAQRQPSASLESSATRFEEPMVVAPLHGFDPQRPPVFDHTLVQGSVGASYLVFDGGAREARIERARAQRAAAGSAAAVAQQALLSETAHSYAAVYSARALLRAQESRASAVEQERDRAARLLAEGRAARILLLRADAALSAADAERAGARAAVEAAERQLSRTMGVPHDAVRAAMVAVGRSIVTAADRDRLVEESLAHTPELRRLEAQAAAAGHAVREAGGEWWPRLTLGGRYVRYGSGAGDAGGEWQTGVQLQVPIYTGGARAAATARARAELRSAEAEVALGRLRVAAAIDEAWSSLVAAVSRADAWRAAVEQNSEVARIERLALDTGAGVQSDYLAAEAELARVRAALAQAEAAELIAHVELARISGVLSLEWIERNVEQVP